MWSPLVLCLLVGFAYASTSPAWKDNSEYLYLVEGRTLSSLHEVADQYSGILVKAKLYINPRSDGKLQGRIIDAQYAQIHNHLPDGWQSEIPESWRSYQSLPLSQKPFQVVMENGLMKSLIVEKELSNWELNIIKSFISQFQWDIQGKSAIDSPINDLPNTSRFNGVFKTMEETVTGKTETLYGIHPLPEYVLQEIPLPVGKLKDNDQVVEVIKSKNYTNAEDRPSYHYGFAEINEFEPTSNKMGQFFIRQGVSHAILTGQFSKFTIQRASTVNKNFFNPTFNNKQMGSVVSMLNVTLLHLNPQNQPPQDLTNPIDIGGLGYTYESPFAQNNEVHPKRYFQHPREDSSEEDYEISFPRYRRSAISPFIVRDNDQPNDEEDQYQPRPEMEQVPESPLLPYYMGYYGTSIKGKSDFDITQSVEKLVTEITKEVQDPQAILRQSTLNKFTILSSLVRIMTQEEIKSLAKKWYNQSFEGQKHLSGKIFFDGVAECGTGPCFKIIREYILSGKITKFEAAQIVNTMANSVRVPTEKYMRNFYELIKDPSVTQQQYLNETAVLSYTDLVYKVYIKRNESHNQFPVHSFGTFYTKEGRDFVKVNVIPYLSQQLHQAISQADSRKIHFFIRALGNVAHKKILEAFEPYLEGQKQASQFQRLLMVIAMDRLVEYNPVVARSVLYKIYQNVAETPEVRVVAIYQIMKTNPPVEMLQQMAESTHTETQEQVVAAIKSALETAAQLESLEQQQLQQAAESALHLLTSESYGGDYSFISLRDFILTKIDMECDHKFLEIGSQDNHWPKTVIFAERGNLNGIQHQYFKVSAMASSIRELLNIFYRQTEEYQNAKIQRDQRSADESQWSSANIADLLKYESKEREQWEAVIVTEIENFQQFWSWNNHSLEHLPAFVMEQEHIFNNGKQFSYNKLKQVDEKALSFPTEMGLPFLYTYDTPMLVSFEGNIKAVATPQISVNNKLHRPDQITAKIDANVTISASVQSHLSFVTPFDHQVYLAGFDKNIQGYLPIKANLAVNVETKQAEIQYEVKAIQEEALLLHYSTWPYTSRSDVINILPVSKRPHTHRIMPQVNQYRYFDVVFGKKETGMAFRAWGHHPVQSLNFGELAEIMQSKGIINVWQQLWDQAELQQTEANIAFIPSQSSVRKFTLRLGQYDEYKKQPEVEAEEEFLNYNQLSSILQSKQPKIRQQEILKHVSSGIKSARLLSYDVSVEFEGDRKYKHIVGAAMAKSDAGPKSRTVIYYKKETQEQKQFWLQVKGDIRNTNGLDLSYSLENKPRAEYKVRLQYGQSEEEAAKISGQVSLQRSEARKQYLIQQEPLYQVCKKQMQEGNFQLPACQNLTTKANFFDYINIELQHERLNNEFVNIVEGVYKGARVYYYPMTEIKFVPSQEKNKLSLNIQFHPENFRQVNFTVKTEEDETRLFNISLTDHVLKTLVVPHPVFHLKSRIIGVLKGWENFRQTCVIDKTAAQTFSNRTYPLSIQNKYTVVLQYIPREARVEQNRESVRDMLKRYIENYVVLARQSSSGQRELLIIFNHQETQGKTVEMIMKPRQQVHLSGSKPVPMVFMDNQPLQFNEEEIAHRYNGLVQVYALPNGEVKVEFRNAFYIIFDGQRFKVTATGSKLLDSIFGLCGRFSKDEYEDFTVPSGCVVRDPSQFVNSYVAEARPVVPRQQRSQESNKQCVKKVLPLYTDVISDLDVGRHGGLHRGEELNTQLRPRYVEEQNGEICFTIRPLPVCNYPSNNIAFKNVAVHCIQGTKTAYYLKNQIDQGGNPDFSQKAETRKVSMPVPTECS